MSRLVGEYDSKKYTWLKKDINFRPDIIISNSKDDWDEKKKPENEKAIIIETKLFGSDLLRRSGNNLFKF